MRFLCFLTVLAVTLLHVTGSENDLDQRGLTTSSKSSVKTSTSSKKTSSCSKKTTSPIKTSSIKTSSVKTSSVHTSSIKASSSTKKTSGFTTLKSTAKTTSTSTPKITSTSIRKTTSSAKTSISSKAPTSVTSTSVPATSLPVSVPISVPSESLPATSVSVTVSVPATSVVLPPVCETLTGNAVKNGGFASGDATDFTVTNDPATFNSINDVYPDTGDAADAGNTYALSIQPQGGDGTVHVYQDLCLTPGLPYNYQFAPGIQAVQPFEIGTGTVALYANDVLLYGPAQICGPGSSAPSNYGTCTQPANPDYGYIYYDLIQGMFVPTDAVVRLRFDFAFTGTGNSAPNYAVLDYISVTVGV